MRSFRVLLSLAVCLSLVSAAACDPSGHKNASQSAVVGGTETPAAVTAVIGTPATVPAPPADTPTPAPSGSPGPRTPTPVARVVNGLQIVDETWVGIVREQGGLRIRSAPRIDVTNVVGSVPQNAQVQVSGRVLNGQEAESGKGNIWLIVGPNQYIYAPPGYVERVQ